MNRFSVICAALRRGLALLLLGAGVAVAQPPETEAQKFERAVTLLEANKFAEAIPLLEAVLKAYPDEESALWNIGVAYAEVGSHREALATWQKMQKAAPGDVRVAAKVMQAHQALGDLPARDKDRETIAALWRALPEPERRKLPRFCREQFVAEGQKVLAFEYFEPASPNRVFFRFVVADAAGEGKIVFDVSSSDVTSAIAREHGEAGPDGRVYHFERYEDEAHFTYAHFKALPTYEQGRAMVADVLAGKTKPVSSSRR